jgi:DNA-binding NarL/FixJ family response regulator
MRMFVTLVSRAARRFGWAILIAAGVLGVAKRASSATGGGVWFTSTAVAQVIRLTSGLVSVTWNGLPVLLPSQYVEQLYARELLGDHAGAVGYLLKDRVFNDDQFVDAIRTVAGGGTVMDPDVVAKLLGHRSRDEPLARLSAREREVLGLMAEGRSNGAIAQQLFVTEKAVSKHTTSIFTKLGLGASEDDNRRVLAVLAYLNS